MDHVIVIDDSEDESSHTTAPPRSSADIGGEHNDNSHTSDKAGISPDRHSRSSDTRREYSPETEDTILSELSKLPPLDLHSDEEGYDGNEDETYFRNDDRYYETTSYKYDPAPDSKSLYTRKREHPRSAKDEDEKAAKINCEHLHYNKHHIFENDYKMNKGQQKYQRRTKQKVRYLLPSNIKDDLNFENVLATLKLLFALEEYLGSLGPKITELMTTAITMEKNKQNSSNVLIHNMTAVVLIEAAKERLKGAVQAGILPTHVTPAACLAVMRSAATLYEADKLLRSRQQLHANSPDKFYPSIPETNGEDLEDLLNKIQKILEPLDELEELQPCNLESDLVKPSDGKGSETQKSCDTQNLGLPELKVLLKNFKYLSIDLKHCVRRNLMILKQGPLPDGARDLLESFEHVFAPVNILTAKTCTPLCKDKTAHYEQKMANSEKKKPISVGGKKTGSAEKKSTNLEMKRSAFEHKIQNTIRKQKIIINIGGKKTGLPERKTTFEGTKIPLDEKRTAKFEQKKTESLKQKKPANIKNTASVEGTKTADLIKKTVLERRFAAFSTKLTQKEMTSVEGQKKKANIQEHNNMAAKVAKKTGLEEELNNNKRQYDIFLYSSYSASSTTDAETMQPIQTTKTKGNPTITEGNPTSTEEKRRPKKKRRTGRKRNKRIRETLGSGTPRNTPAFKLGVTNIYRKAINDISRTAEKNARPKECTSQISTSISLLEGIYGNETAARISVAEAPPKNTEIVTVAPPQNTAIATVAPPQNTAIVAVVPPDTNNTAIATVAPPQNAAIVAVVPPDTNNTAIATVAPPQNTAIVAVVPPNTNNTALATVAPPQNTTIVTVVPPNTNNTAIATVAPPQNTAIVAVVPRNTNNTAMATVPSPQNTAIVAVAPSKVAPKSVTVDLTGTQPIFTESIETIDLTDGPPTPLYGYQTVALISVAEAPPKNTAIVTVAPPQNAAIATVAPPQNTAIVAVVPPNTNNTAIATVPPPQNTAIVAVVPPNNNNTAIATVAPPQNTAIVAVVPPNTNNTAIATVAPPQNTAIVAVAPPNTNNTAIATVPPPQNKAIVAVVPPNNNNTAIATVAPPQNTAIVAVAPPNTNNTAIATVPPPQNKAIVAVVPPNNNNTAIATVAPPQNTAIVAVAPPNTNNTAIATVPPPQNKAIVAVVPPNNNNTAIATVAPPQNTAIVAVAPPNTNKTAIATVAPPQNTAIVAVAPSKIAPKSVTVDLTGTQPIFTESIETIDITDGPPTPQKSTEEKKPLEAEPKEESLIQRLKQNEKQGQPKVYHFYTDGDVCPICEKISLIREDTLHPVSLCPIFVESNGPERWALARKNSLCFSCLERKSIAITHTCVLVVCRIDNCTLSHHNLLHCRK